jgi:hypothetical protein
MLKELYEAVKNHPDFKHEGYLVHFFGSLKGDFSPDQGWQIGFYVHEKNIVLTYTLDGDALKVQEGKPFQREEHKITELELENIKVSFEEMTDKIIRFQKEKYPSQPPVKAIVVLQHIDSLIWNVTFVTAAFSTLNIKLDAVSGEIIDHKLSSLLQWDANANNA